MSKFIEWLQSANRTSSVEEFVGSLLAELRMLKVLKPYNLNVCILNKSDMKTRGSMVDSV